MSPKSADQRLAQALERSVRRYAEGLRTAEHARLAAREAGSLLARLGLPTRLPPSSAATEPADRERAFILGRLRAESGRLVRLARSASPAYDLNRHIALRRLIADFETPAPGRKPSARPAPPRAARPPRIMETATYSTKTRELAAAPVESMTEMSTKPASPGVQDA